MEVLSQAFCYSNRKLTSMVLSCPAGTGISRSRLWQKKHQYAEDCRQAVWDPQSDLFMSQKPIKVGQMDPHST